MKSQISKTIEINNSKSRFCICRGYIAMTAVIILASGLFFISLVSISVANFYADSVLRRELRFQAKLNVRACLDVASIMVAKDYFLQGTLNIGYLGCIAEVANSFTGDVSLNAVASMEGVSEYAKRTLRLSDNDIVVISEDGY